MAVIRRRLIFWLIKAYIKKLGPTILISFIVGLLLFFGLFFLTKNFTNIFPVYKRTVIGIAGAYTIQTLPPEILTKLSHGLTQVADDGTIKPDIAKSWSIQDDGKTYIFKLNENAKFTNGKPVTSDTITSDYSDVTINRPDKETIVYKLKDTYSPFLVTASQPLFDKGFIGDGDYEVEDIKLNGNFIQTLRLISVKNKLDTIQYQFYPTEDALKLAFLMGEINQTQGLKDITFKDTSLNTYPNTQVTKYTDYTKLVTLFFNYEDSTLADKKMRLALSYALPSTYPDGERTYVPYSPKSIYFNNQITPRTQDFDHAKLLFDSATSATASGKVTLTIKTLKKYEKTASSIAAAWEKLGIQTNIEEVTEVPDTFQIFLGDFKVPHDPDQYVLWHSSQIQLSNISRYKNIRIDKLLEEGRKTTNIDERKGIYDDFQKYLLEDPPAAFLYFPYGYSLTKK